MFERYTDEARGVLFFARHEAASLASGSINTEHLLLGLLRQRNAIVTQYVPPEALDNFRREMGAHSQAAIAQRNTSTSVDLPLDEDAKAVLRAASDEAESLSAIHIRPEHLLLGLLQNPETTSARMLKKHGVAYQCVRQDLVAATPDAESAGGAAVTKAPSLEAAASRFQRILATASQQLPKVLTPATPVTADKWTPHQILGHLIDSASNNHQRFVRAATSNELNWPNYEQEPWVQAQAYADAPWANLVALWYAYNEHLLWVIRHIPEDKLHIVCRIGTNAPLTLGELVTGYLDHLEHHLKQILG